MVRQYQVLIIPIKVGYVKKILEHQKVVGNLKKAGDTHLVCKPKRPLKTLVNSHAESQD